MKKKIVWTVSGIYPDLAKKIGVTLPKKRAWVFCLFVHLKKIFENKVEFHVITSTRKVNQVKKFEIEGTWFYLLPMDKNAHKSKYVKELSCLKQTIEEISPDLIHIHGTEEYYGLISEHIEKPVIISLQGIRQEIKRYYFSDISRLDYIKFALKYRNYGMIKSLSVWKQKSADENRLIKMNKYFIGRTLFDKACCLGINQEAEYLSGEDHRLLRPEFYSANWKIENSENYTIHTTISETTYKGIFLIIKAINLLVKKYPKFKINIAGTFKGPIGKEVAREIKKRNLHQHINMLGNCNAQQLVDSMLKSRVFLMGSYIENSPNSLQEAQVVGIPSIASFTGGIPSLIDDFETGLMYPRGDLLYMVNLISEVFNNPTLAVSLSEKSKQLKETRNNPEKLAKLYKTIYSKFL